jgi:hypothetical protein
VSGGWERALAECEARLDAVEGLDPAELTTAGGGLVIPAFADPGVGQPLPVALAGRAQACLDRTDALHARLTGELDRIRGELRRLPRLPRAPREGRFDAQA